MPKVSEVISTLPENGVSIQKYFSDIYRQIGAYFINNADRLGNSVVDEVSSIDISICLEPRSLVTIDITQKELLIKRELPTDENNVEEIVNKFTEAVKKRK